MLYNNTRQCDGLRYPRPVAGCPPPCHHDQVADLDPQTAAELAALAAAEARAQEAASIAGMRFDDGLRAVRAWADPPTWADLAAATGHTVQALRWRLRDGDYRPPSVEMRISAEGRSRAKSDPEEGLSLQVAADQLGIHRQTLRNRVARAADTPGQRVVFDLDGQRVTVQAAAQHGLPWRVWLDE